MKNKSDGLTILVCGSSKFDDKSFVFGILDALFNELNGKIDTIVTSRFSGASHYAREWTRQVVDLVGVSIKIEDCNFDDILEEKNLSLYESVDIPSFILKNDPFFQKGKEKLLETGVKMVCAFPNKEGVLGTATLNIQRFASLAGISCCDCSSAFDIIKTQRYAEENSVENKSEVKQLKP